MVDIRSLAARRSFIEPGCLLLLGRKLADVDSRQETMEIDLIPGIS
jgi:hypothetical protein